ncbi:hypothetical protein BLNAU_8502 [Blattamonas nauphoetae]|uniref:Uncharacterized protein n=1 Tax=Blattamonas nauphoetae TaxID=2049346 RepID=A0ABQ9XY83_9EUKA|nr:hypothetical protein BLNAU_8502 [Blattamonas nauphoetae]
MSPAASYSPLARPGTERGATVRLPTPSLATRFTAIRSISDPISANLVFTNFRALCTSPLQPEHGFAQHSPEVVNIILEGAGRMTRNGKLQTTLEQKTPFPASSICAPHAALRSTDPHPRQSSALINAPNFENSPPPNANQSKGHPPQMDQHVRSHLLQRTTSHKKHLERSLDFARNLIPATPPAARAGVTLIQNEAERKAESNRVEMSSDCSAPLYPSLTPHFITIDSIALCLQLSPPFQQHASPLDLRLCQPATLNMPQFPRPQSSRAQSDCHPKGSDQSHLQVLPNVDCSNHRQHVERTRRSLFDSKRSRLHQHSVIRLHSMQI